jgi:hypothetical protein
MRVGRGVKRAEAGRSAPISRSDRPGMIAFATNTILETFSRNTVENIAIL